MTDATTEMKQNDLENCSVSVPPHKRYVDRGEMIDMILALYVDSMT